MAIPRGESGARLDTAAGRAAEAEFQRNKAAAVAEAAMRVAQSEAEHGRLAAAQAAMAAAQAAAQAAPPAVQQAVQAHSQQLITGGSGAPPVPPPPPPPPAPAPAPKPVSAPAPAPQPTPQQAAAILNAGGDTSKFNAATWEALKQIEAANNAAAAQPVAPAPAAPKPAAPAPGTGGAGGGPGIVNTPSGPQIGTLPPSAPAAPAAPVTPPTPAPQPGQPAGSPGPIVMPQGGREVTLSYAEQVEQRINALLAEGNIDAARLQAGNITGGGPGVQNVLARINTAIGAAEAARNRVIESQKPPVTAPPVDDGGGGGKVETEQDRYYKWLRQQQELEFNRQATERAEQKRQERETASSFLRGILNQYGMGSLGDQVETLINSWGNNTAVIAEQLRKTPEYRTRFKGLVQLQERGVTDIRDEAQYLNLETQYRDVFRTSGLRDFLGQSGTQTEYDAIAKLVGDYSLSVNEVRARVSDAQRVAAETPQEVRDALKRFYGVDSADLVSYSLDPTRTMTRINEKANAAILGGYAARAGLDIGVGTAERIAGLAGGEDINVQRVQEDVMGAREIRDATRRLAEIERSTLSDEEVLTAQTRTGAEPVERIRTLQSRERARFGGSSAFTGGSLARARTI